MQLINILIRTSNRPAEFRKCIASIRAQNYKKVNVIIVTDSPETSLPYIRESVNNMNAKVFSTKCDGVPYHWNFYCNDLKEQVTEGWFFYLDDDDWISSRTSLNAIAPHLQLNGHGVICQYYRGRRPKPSNLVIRRDGTVDPESIIKGRIGGSAIFLHHTHKDLAFWDGNRAADYRYIKAIAEKLPLKFVPIPIVQAGNSGRHGR